MDRCRYWAALQAIETEDEHNSSGLPTGKVRTLLVSRDKSYGLLASRGFAGNYRVEKEYLGSVGDSKLPTSVPDFFFYSAKGSQAHFTICPAQNNPKAVSTYMPRNLSTRKILSIGSQPQEASCGARGRINRMHHPALVRRKNYWYLIFRLGNRPLFWLVT